MLPTFSLPEGTAAAEARQEPRELLHSPHPTPSTSGAHSDAHVLCPGHTHRGLSTGKPLSACALEGPRNRCTEEHSPGLPHSGRRQEHRPGQTTLKMSVWSRVSSWPGMRGLLT